MLLSHHTTRLGGPCRAMLFPSIPSVFEVVSALGIAHHEGKTKMVKTAHSSDGLSWRSVQNYTRFDGPCGVKRPLQSMCESGSVSATLFSSRNHSICISWVLDTRDRLGCDNNGTVNQQSVCLNFRFCYSSYSISISLINSNHFYCIRFIFHI